MINYLQVENLSKWFGDLVIFENISFTINKDQKTALIAKNGTGKTSLLNIIAGLDTANDGTITFKNDLVVGYLAQEPKLDGNKTIIEQIFSSSNEKIDAIKKYELAIELNDREKIEESVLLIDNLGAWDFEVKVKQILFQLKITELNKKIQHLSGGQKKRVALAEVLLLEPDLLILDEPTNHLDTEMIEWLEEYLFKTNSTLFMVTHDRYFLDRVCDEIIEIDNNQVFVYKGNYNYYLEKRQERIENMVVNIEKASNILRTETEWMRRMPKARGTKAKYRIDNFHKLKEIASQQIDNSSLEIEFTGRRLGKKVIEFDNISKSLGGKLLFQNFSYKFTQGDRVGIVGPNGSGKTTFLNVISQILLPDNGRIEQGETVVIGYYQQKGLEFEADKRVIDIIQDEAEVINLGNGRQLSALQFLEHFQFPRSKHYVAVEKLSGGEKRRLYLMTVLLKNPNFLILDEPTNDLDIITLNVLEDYLLHFSGCILIVSHDRYFLDKITNYTFGFDGKGNIENFPGTYSYYFDNLKIKEAEQRKEFVKTKETEGKKEKQKSEKKKMTFKERKEFEELESDLENLNTEKNRLENEINSGDVHHEELTKKSIRIKEIMNLIDEKEMRWLELSEIES